MATNKQRRKKRLRELGKEQARERRSQARKVASRLLGEPFTPDGYTLRHYGTKVETDGR